MGIITSILTILILTLQIKIKAGQNYCYADDISPHRSFSSITSYFLSRGPQIDVSKDCTGCTPYFVWGIIRHATTYPSSSAFIAKAIKTLPKLRDRIIQNHEQGILIILKGGNLCEKDLNNLQRWNISLNPDLVMELTPQGIEEMRYLGQNMASAFSQLLKPQSTPLFTFQSSATNRSKGSLVAFASTFLKQNFSSKFDLDPTKSDKFLRLSRHCPYYEKLLDSLHLWKETQLFESSALWQKITAEISLRLGFLQPLPFGPIIEMYYICAYENAWYNNTKPPFCAVFTPEELKTIEYLHDMHFYQGYGYGNSYIIEKMGCPIVKDMIETLSNVSKNIGNSTEGKFMFSHAESIVSVLVKLGLLKEDKELKFENYKEKINNRIWRGSHIHNFASNILAVLCRRQDKNDSQNIVLFYLNERPMRISQCSNNPCTLEELQNIYQDVSDENQCNTKFCEIPEKPKKSSACWFYMNSHIIVICILIIKFII